MNQSEFIASGVVELYVLGICTEAEKIQIDTLRTTDAALEAAIQQFEVALEQQLAKQPTLPVTEDIDEKIIAIFNTPAIQKSATVIPITNASKKKNIYTKLAIAASLLLCITVAINYWSSNKKVSKNVLTSNTSKTLPLSDSLQLVNKANIIPITMFGQGTHSICRCTMYWDTKAKKAFIQIHHLATTDATTDYQLWATVNGKPVSIGMVDESIRNSYIILENTPNTATEFYITREGAGGNTNPSSDVYVKGTAVI